jgi:two-component system KDP operon response regulator KdpE
VSARAIEVEHEGQGPAPVVLVVEDEPQLMRFLRASLSTSGHRVIEATTGQSALAAAAMHSPDVILLDLGLPDMDGVDVARRLREWATTPIIVVSARRLEDDKVRALDAGADDYLTKPFGTGELLARIRVALRVAARIDADSPGTAFQVDTLRVDLAARRVWLAGREVRLTRTEYRLLATLVKHAGKVVTHGQLLREVWGPGATNQNQYLRVYMGQLRRKLEADPARPRFLQTHTGVGYCLRAE